MLWKDWNQRKVRGVKFSDRFTCDLVPKKRPLWYIFVNRKQKETIHYVASEKDHKHYMKCFVVFIVAENGLEKDRLHVQPFHN